MVLQVFLSWRRPHTEIRAWVELCGRLCRRLEDVSKNERVNIFLCIVIMDKFLASFQENIVVPLEKEKSKIHIRGQQQGRRYITTVEGLDDDLDLKRISHAMKKALSCSVTVIEDTIIQLQGDKREDVRTWLVKNEVLTDKEAEVRIIVHGA
jgi:translation initiation factor 1